MRRKSRLLGWFAGGVVGVLAVFAGVGASSAMAAKCTNTNYFEGQGAALQRFAQVQVWAPLSGCKVLYTAKGSGPGLEAFGVFTSKLEYKYGFIGTDEPPNAEQLFEMEAASGGGQPVVIPVAQSAIAIIVKPPANCDPTKIENASLEKVFNGLALLWSEIQPAPVEKVAKACDVGITRVVRRDSAGTTYQLKRYLFEIDKNALACTGAKKRSWVQLLEAPVSNVEWPGYPASCGGTEGPVTTIVVPAVTGELDEIETVRSTEGSIGYADIGFAREFYSASSPSSMYWLEVQSNGLKPESVYEWPGTKGTEPSQGDASSNCARTTYNNLTKVEKIEADQDWSEVYPIFDWEWSVYPICTFTWDIAWEGYEKAGYPIGSKATIGEATRQYLEYVTASGSGEGQWAIEQKHDYLGLPEGASHVSEMAKKLAKLVDSK